MNKIKNENSITTLDYYNKNAKEFNKETFSIDFESKQNMLLKYLDPNAHILDLGCGSGRDSKAFIKKGYRVTAMDGSIELCKIASRNIGQEVICKRFNELNEVDIFDSVWACSSIIHVPSTELYDVIYFTKDNFEIFLKQFGELELVEVQITDDARVGREDEKWLNVIVRKKDK